MEKRFVLLTKEPPFTVLYLSYASWAKEAPPTAGF